LSRPLDVPLLRPRSARKNLLANVGRGYVGEPSPLVPFGISPYVPHFLFSSVSLSQFNSALSHRLSPYLPFFVALLVFIFFPLPVSPFLACLRWWNETFLVASQFRVFFPLSIRFALYLCSFYLFIILRAILLRIYLIIIECTINSTIHFQIFNLLFLWFFLLVVFCKFFLAVHSTRARVLYFIYIYIYFFFIFSIFISSL